MVEEKQPSVEAVAWILLAAFSYTYYEKQEHKGVIWKILHVARKEL